MKETNNKAIQPWRTHAPVDGFTAASIKEVDEPA
jgi:hypothetical protein